MGAQRAGSETTYEDLKRAFSIPRRQREPARFETTYEDLKRLRQGRHGVSGLVLRLPTRI